MKILVDENIPLISVRVLRELGHDVLDIRGTSNQGMSDEALWELTQQEGRLLITTDVGFSQHRFEPHAGILIVSLKQPNRDKIHQRIIIAMAQFREEQWVGIVVTMKDVVQSVWPASNGH